jgi:hypothetical protein
VFENWGVSIPLSSDTRLGSPGPVPGPTPLSGPAPDRVGELRDRMNGMQRDRWQPVGKRMPGALADVLPSGVLRSGVVYTVENSTSLLMAVLAAATGEGEWAAVVGLPDFGAEAAAGFGLDLERLVLVPSPGKQWLAVTAALVDVLPFVVVRPERAVGSAEASRLSARLRQAGSTLIVAGAWSQGEAALTRTNTTWRGLGTGHGSLAGQDVDVAVTDRGGRRRVARLHLPDSSGATEEPAFLAPTGPRTGAGPTRHPVAG